MSNFFNWSWKIGSLFRIRIELHLIFIIYLAAEALSNFMKGFFALGTAILLMSFGLVLLHEFGHCFAARWTGGHASRILMWPLGGLAFVDVPHKPAPTLIVAVAGPAVNVILAALSAPFVFKFTVPGFAGLILNSFFWANVILVLFNLLPAYPMDGGRVLQALLWKKYGFEKSTYFASTVSMVAAVAVIIVSMSIFNSTMMFALGLFIFITAWQTREMLKLGANGRLGLDFSSAPEYGLDEYYTEKQKPRTPFFTRIKLFFLKRRMEREGDREREARETVDRLLDKISHQGRGSLTPDELHLLEKYSKYFHKHETRH